MTKYQDEKKNFESTQAEDESIESLAKLSTLAKSQKIVNRIVDADQIEKAVKLADKKLLPNDLEVAQSLNGQTCLTKDTKLVIVGTITPIKGMKHGYFYTSSGRNKVYKTLDDYFKPKCTRSSLVEQKKSLKSASNDVEKQKIIDEIKEILKKYKIAFIDVIKTAVRKQNEASDLKIVLFDLDYDAFKKCKNVEKYICTSNNTADCLKEIFKKNGTTSNSGKISICHQDLFHYKYEEWKDEMDEVF